LYSGDDGESHIEALDLASRPDLTAHHGTKGVMFRSTLAAQSNFVLSLFRQGSEEHQAGEPVDPLPTYIPPNESPATNPALAQHYPLNLLSPKSHAFLNSSYGNLPEQRHYAGEQRLLLHPQDAIARGISDGAVVRVFNTRGAFEAVAEITADVMPGVVVAPLGYWRRLSRAQATVQAVNSSTYADLGRAPTFSDTLVEVALVAVR
jgi:anaerobic selenocysteine-containing dehydrogenase